MPENVSLFHYYSIGIVAVDKAIGSKDIEVTPIEITPFLDGEITDNGVEETIKSQDASGKAFNVKVTTSATIPATWLSIGSSNRQTAPDVRRGEEVMIYRYGDTDKYYWTCHRSDINLRRLETAIWAFSATAETEAEITADNTYYMEVSTHRGLIHIHTSAANNELTTYDLQINAKDGHFIVIDGKNNQASLDSNENRFQFITASESSIDLHDKDLVVTIVGNTTVNTTGNTEVNTEGNTTVKTTGDATVETTGNNVVKGATNTIVGPTTIIGPLTTNAEGGGATKSKLIGDFEIQGNITQTQGDFTTSGNLTGNVFTGTQGNFPNLD